MVMPTAHCLTASNQNGAVGGFSNEWYKKNPKRLSFAWCSVWKPGDANMGLVLEPIFTREAEMFRILLVPFIRKSVQITKC